MFFVMTKLLLSSVNDCSWQYLIRYKKDGDAFSHKTIIACESWCYHYESEYAVKPSTIIDAYLNFPPDLNITAEWGLKYFETLPIINLSKNSIGAGMITFELMKPKQFKSSLGVWKKNIRLIVSHCDFNMFETFKHD